jgi:phage protein D
MQKFVGVITSVSPAFPESGVPIIVIRGRSLYDRLNTQCDAKAFTAKTDSGIAREIADKLNLGFRGDDTKAEHPLISSESGTYGAILKKRADRIGFEVVVKERTLFFERPRYLTDRSPTLTLEWGKSLKSFTPTLTTYKKYTHVSVRSSQTSYERGKAPIEGSAGPGDEGAIMGNESASRIAMRISGKNELRSDEHDIVSQEEANIVALARLEESSLDFITGQGACNGNPQLTARAVIELKGLGQRFSGSYYVVSATHVIDGSGYRTDFQVKRNGI